MDVQHDITDADRQPENADAALRRRQEAEDAETLRVRGPQRPGQQAPVAAASTPRPTPSPTPGTPVGPTTIRPPSAPSAPTPPTAPTPPATTPGHSA